MIINQKFRKSTEVRVQGVVRAMPAERRVTRPKARTKDTMISPKTWKGEGRPSSVVAERVNC